MSKLAKMKAALKAALTPEEVAAREAFKSQFTPGFYHGSPSPNIKSFDPNKSKKDLDLVTPGVTFVSPDPKFADSFLSVQGKPSYNLQTAEIKAPTQYKPGGTMYPVSVNLQNHFDPNTPQGLQVVKDYVDNLYDNPVDKAKFLARVLDPHSNWQTMESPKFLQHLRNTGHETFAVNEGGIQNVGVLKPENIRGKFADFDPAEAANPDFMKAEGGLVGYAPGGKVGALSELIKMIKNQGGAAAGRRLEKAADLVPNLEHKFQSDALKSAFTGDNASAVMVMKPSEFQNYAAPLSQEHKAYQGYKIGDPSLPTTPTGSHQDYINYLTQFQQPGAGGFSSVPYLQIDNKSYLPSIYGHEGRHRSEALQLLGDDPSLVVLQPTSRMREPLPRRSQDEFLEALKSQYGDYKGNIKVNPEKIDGQSTRPLINLPPSFKSGGKV
jgi:hypothetical protein